MPLRIALSALLFLALAGCSREPEMLGQGDLVFDRDALIAQIRQIEAAAAPAVLGVGVQDLSTGQTVAYNGDRPFPMQSVFKAPLAAAALAQVESGRLSLDEVIEIRDVDLSPPRSAVADAWPAQSRYTLGELLERTVIDSDNTAADAVMKRIGGPGVVTAWLQGKQVIGIRVDRYERQLQPELAGLASFRAAWKGQAAFGAAMAAVPRSQAQTAATAALQDPRDTATPAGALRFLEALAPNEMLKPASSRRLNDLMTRAGTGQNRLAAATPPGGSLAHKTGTARTAFGVNAATNDIGLFTLKDGRRVAVAVFLTGSTQDAAARDAVIAEVGRAVVAAAQ
jgi:beta-lactamase class A